MAPVNAFIFRVAEGLIVLLNPAFHCDRASVVDLVSLTKPRLAGLVIATTAVGLAVASTPIALWRAALVVAATAGLVGAANMLNSYLERDVDARMPRTAQRPLAAGRLDPRLALWGGIIGGVITIPVLALVANLLTAILGAVAYLTYVALYTPLKRHSSWALPVGAVAGAMPPAMGVVAATNRFDATALVLFLILFCWQLPHFIAISLYLKDDYAKGGLKVFAVVHGVRASVTAAIGNAVVLLLVSFMAPPVGLGGSLYPVVAGILGAAFVALSVMGLWAVDAHQWAKRLFRASLLYLVVLLVAVVA